MKGGGRTLCLSEACILNSKVKKKRVCQRLTHPLLFYRNNQSLSTDVNSLGNEMKELRSTNHQKMAGLNRSNE